MSNVSREHKSNVFSLLCEDKKRLLPVYNAVNHSAYDDPELLEIVTLEYAICMKIRNDAAFVINSELNIYEHQSTVSENLPLRDLYYVAEELRRIAPPKTLYRKQAVKIPTPHFITFYNGTESFPEREVYYLSDMYEKNEGEPELELKVTVLNINPGFNEELKADCEILMGYMTFVEKVRGKTAAGMDIENAVNEAVNECISEGILADFFREKKEKIVEVSIWEFNQELYEQAMREDGEVIGYKKGEAAGLEKGESIGLEKGVLQKLVSLVCKKMKMGQSLQKIAEDLAEEVSDIEPIYNIAGEPDIGCDADKVFARLVTTE